MAVRDIDRFDPTPQPGGVVVPVISLVAMVIVAVAVLVVAVAIDNGAGFLVVVGGHCVNLGNSTFVGFQNAILSPGEVLASLILIPCEISLE